MTSLLNSHAEMTSTTRARPGMAERIGQIMEALGPPPMARTLDEVVARTGLPRTTVHRILEQLIELRWVDHGPDGYRFGRLPLDFRGPGFDHASLRAAAAPVLHELAVRTDRVAHLAVLDRTGVYFLDKVGGRFAANVPTRVGGRAPAHCTAVGKALLAWRAPEQIDDDYAGGLVRLTPNSLRDLGSLHRELNAVRAAGGLAYDREETAPHIMCVAMAIRGPDGILGAISLTADCPQLIERLAPTLMIASRAVSRRLLGDQQAHSSPGDTRRSTGR